MSLPHDMVAWKAAAEDLAAQRDLLARRVEQLEAALRELVGEYFGNSVPSADIDAMYERARAALSRATGSEQ